MLEDINDIDRANFMPLDLAKLGKDLSIPVHMAGNVVVPILTADSSHL